MDSNFAIPSALIGRSLMEIQVSDCSAADAGKAAQYPWPGPASRRKTTTGPGPVATHFVLWMPSGATSGKTTTIYLVAADAQNHLVDDYRGTVHLFSSDLSAVLPEKVGFDRGRAQLEMTFGTAGQQTVTASDQSTASITGTATTNVAAPDVASHFVFSLPSGATPRKALTVQILAEDAENFVVKDFNNTVDLSSSDQSATLPACVTFKQGRATFQVAFATAGLQTITATDQTDSSLTGAGQTHVIDRAAANPKAAQVATHFVVYLSPGAKAGSPVTVRIVAEDASNNVAVNFTGMLNLSSADAAATLPKSVAVQDGQVTFFEATFATTGTQVITVNDAANPALTGSASTHVAAIPSATHFVVFMQPGAAVGTPVTVRIVAQNAQNHPVTNFNGTVNLSSSDERASLPAEVTLKDGRASFQLTFATERQQSVTVSAGDDPSISGTATTNVGGAGASSGSRLFISQFREGRSQAPEPGANW